MKWLILIYLLLDSCHAQAGWFLSNTNQLNDAKARITTLETEAKNQQRTLDQWQIACGLLGVGCVIFFVIGSALGSQTRKHHELSSGRMGRSTVTSPAGPNGTKPAVVGKKPRQNRLPSLAT